MTPDSYWIQLLTTLLIHRERASQTKHLFLYLLWTVFNPESNEPIAGSKKPPY